MKKIILLNKKEGETPLERVESFRAKNPVYRDAPLTYAGRLDPMAEGLLLVLAGDKTKDKEKFLKFNKEYEFQILFGFATDTYDILGRVVRAKNTGINKLRIEKLISENLAHFVGKFSQKYPIYSSRTVAGKPLFSYARRGDKVEIPAREVEVTDLMFGKISKITGTKLLQNIEKRIEKVNGDFRQKEILKRWQQKIRNENYYIADFKIKCSSGTYVRGIANSLGEKIKIPALAYAIKRTRIGKYKLSSSI